MKKANETPEAMKKIIRIVIVVAAAMLYLFPENGSGQVQTTQALKSSTAANLNLSDIFLAARDLKTGVAVNCPSFILFNQSEDTVLSIHGCNQGDPTNFKITLPVGRYTAVVQASGYSSMSARVTIDPSGPRLQTFNLVSMIEDVRLSNQYILARCNRSESFFFNGYVTNRLGEQVNDARVVIGSQQTFTDKTGYFELSIPIMGRNEEVVTLEISHPAYSIYRQIGVHVWPYGNWQTKITLPNKDEETLQLDETPRLFGQSAESQVLYDSGNEDEFNGEPDDVTACLPSTINVGFSSTGTVCCYGGSPSCTTIQTYPLDDYVKHVLPAEWIASWNTSDAFKAGAIAIRSYSINRINHPVYGGAYDICSSPCCQMYGANTSISTSDAVDQTANYVLQLSSGDVALTEYSAENNHLLPNCGGSNNGQGCSNGQFYWSGTCYSDVVSTGMRLYGHGRGMSQRGSARWSSGRNMSSCSNTLLSTYHGYGTKTWQQILALYYPTLVLTTCPASSVGNDNCSQATSITSSTNCTYTSGTVAGATASGVAIPSCTGFTSGTALDVWYSFIAQASTHDITVDPGGSNSTSVDAVIAIYDACNSGGFIDCCDQPGGGGVTSTCTFTGLTVGNTYYVRVFDYGSQAPTDGTFDICVTHTGGSGGQHDFYPDNLVLSATTFTDGDPITITVDQYTSAPTAASVSVALEYTVRTTSGSLIQQLGTDNSSVGGNDPFDPETINATFPSGVPAGQCQICAEANYDLAVPESNTSNNRLCQTVTVTSAIPSYEVILSAVPASGGTVSGGGFYNSGDPVTATATPNSGWTFTNWTENGNVVSTNASYSFNVTANRTLEANFTQTASNYTVQVNAVPGNGGTVSGGGPYSAGSNVYVNAIPNSGWTFVNWTENGNVVAYNASYSFTINSNRVLEANFTNSSNLIVQVIASPTNGGNVTGGGSYNAGDPVTIVATPNSGWSFVDWTENGNQISTNPSYSFTISANRTFQANFTNGTATYTIQGIANPTNAGAVIGGGNYIGGIPATLYAIPNSGWQLLNWMENGNIIATSSPYIFTVNANRTLVANFTPNITGVAPGSELLDFQVFPNPNNGNFTITFPTKGTRKICIYDALGRVLVTKEAVTNESVAIQLENSSPGTYFVIVSDRSGKSSVRAVIFQ